MKYSELLNKPYKKELIADISKELKKYYNNMEGTEIIMLSNEIYTACVLMYHNVSYITIIQFLNTIDYNYYFDIAKGRKSMLETAITDNTKIHLQTIIKKYIIEIQKKDKVDKI